MEYEFNKKDENIKNLLDEDTEYKNIEEFLNKAIPNVFNPQELLTVIFSVEFTQYVLNLFLNNTYMALVDVKDFLKDHPEYGDVDFNNLDDDTTMRIRDFMESVDKTESAYFNSGSILTSNVIKVMDSVLLRMQNAYIIGYGKPIPEDTAKFFAILKNSLEGSLDILKSVLQGNEQKED